MINTYLTIGVFCYLYAKWEFANVRPHPTKKRPPLGTRIIVGLVFSMVCWPLVLWLIAIKVGAIKPHGLDFDTMMRADGHDDWEIKEDEDE